MHSAAACGSSTTGPTRSARCHRHVTWFEPHGRCREREWPRGSLPLLKDPIAVFSAGWLARTFGMRVVLSVRHPAAFAASLKRLDWTFDFDHLTCPAVADARPARAVRWEIERPPRVRPGDIIDQAALLWTVIYGSVGGASGSRCARRISDRNPVTEIERLYQRLGLTWSAEVAAKVRRPRARTIPPKRPPDAPTPGAKRRARSRHLATPAGPPPRSPGCGS